MIPLTNSKLCADRFRDVWDPRLKTKEFTYIICLNDKMQQLFFSEICSGRFTDCHFDIREAVLYALTIHSNYILIAHNHTSGIPDPSEQDIAFTTRLKEWLTTINIVLVDHIILTGNDYYSFADNGLLEKKIA